VRQWGIGQGEGGITPTTNSWICHWGDVLYITVISSQQYSLAVV